MRKSYFYLLITFLIIGIATTALHFSPAGNKFEDGVTSAFNPDEIVSVYWDELDDFGKQESVHSVAYGRNRYNSQLTTASIPTDGILLVWTEDAIEKAKSNYENSKVYGRITVHAEVKTSNVRNASAELAYKDSSGNYYYDMDLSEVFWAIYEDKTWSDIGYQSTDLIDLWLPGPKNVYYPIYVAQIYAGVEEYMKKNLTEVSNITESDVWEVVDDILERANYIQGTNNPKLNKNTIILTVKKSGSLIVEPTTSVGIPIYAFYNNEAYEGFLDRHNLPKYVGLANTDGETSNTKNYQAFYETSDELLSKVNKHLNS